MNVPLGDPHHVLPQRAVVKNTFLEFEDAEEDPWFVTCDPHRQKTDSLLERSSLSLRHELEQSIREAAKAADAATLDLPVSSFSKGLDGKLGDYLLHGLPHGVASHGVVEPSPESEAAADSKSQASASTAAARSTSSATEEEKQRRREIAMNGGGLSGARTVMIRNIPVKYTQRMLIREINNSGFNAKYDFFYLPVDQRCHANRGFAFINFLSPELAQSFYAAFDRKRLRHFEAEKDLAVLPADLQGFEQNAEHFASARTARRTRIVQNRPVFLRPLPPRLAGTGSAKPTQVPEPPQPETCAAPAKSRSSQPPIEESPQAAKAAGPSVLAAKFCAFCGKPRQADFLFCPFCGKRSPV